MKFNYSLDNSVQNVGAFDAYIQLSKDGKFLNIYNKKIIRKPHFIYNPDIKEIE